ncbi:hypothetical protein SFC65_19115 [Priestia filamentosa]|uniref:hypothetical protein n=1 Tax=Priestia filamentosa TaxID=1402861 RepID=UPI0039819D16
MKLICRACETEISREVNKLEDLSRLNDIDEQDYIPEGFYTIATKKSDLYSDLHKEGSIIINIKDLINSDFHSNGSRLNGCCGCDGLDGMNRVCSNNHEIGTEKSDCWMSHCIGLNPELVKLIP